MTRSKGQVSAQALEILSGKSMKKATGKSKKKSSPKQGTSSKKILTKKGNKTKNRRKTSQLKKQFHKPGHWKDPDPYRFWQDMLRQFERGCKKVSEERSKIKKNRKKPYWPE